MKPVKETSAEIATRFVETCRKYGWNYEVRGSILTITKKIIPGDNDSLTRADMEYGSIFCHVPRTTSGSTWGTDCGGIGALSALNSGNFKMNMSGGSKRVLTAISKIR